MTRTENTKSKQGQWKKGESGNPSGRPRGARNRTTIAAETLLEGEAEQLTRKAIELALSGDTTALRLCMERITPARKGRRIELELPRVEGASDLLAAMTEVLAAMASGRISPEEAATMAGVLEAKRRAIETVDLAERIQKLESRR